MLALSAFPRRTWAKCLVSLHPPAAPSASQGISPHPVAYFPLRIDILLTAALSTATREPTQREGEGSKGKCHRPCRHETIARNRQTVPTDAIVPRGVFCPSVDRSHRSSRRMCPSLEPGRSRSPGLRLSRNPHTEAADTGVDLPESRALASSLTPLNRRLCPHLLQLRHFRWPVCAKVFHRETLRSRGRGQTYPTRQITHFR